MEKMFNEYENELEVIKQNLTKKQKEKLECILSGKHSLSIDEKNRLTIYCEYLNLFLTEYENEVFNFKYKKFIATEKMEQYYYSILNFTNEFIKELDNIKIIEKGE